MEREIFYFISYVFTLNYNNFKLFMLDVTDKIPNNC